MSQPPLVVVSHLEDLSVYLGPVLSAEDFLGQDTEAPLVINLCRGWRYLSEGYYVSLLAEARGLDVIPTPATIAGIQDPQRLFRSLAEAGIPIVRCRLRDVNFMLTVHSDMNFEIIARFRAAGISIPFPQRDVHIQGLDRIVGSIGPRPAGEEPA